MAALVGPTASGKSALALALAQRAPDVELVSVDAMQVYRGMDVGTAKPSPAERAAVRHHLLDLADPTEPFSVAEWKAAADRALAAGLSTHDGVVLSAPVAEAHGYLPHPAAQGLP